MSDLTTSNSPGAKHSDWAIWLIGTKSRADTAIRQGAEVAGRSVFEVHVGAVRDSDHLIGEIGREFLVPYEMSGLDAVLSVLSDLDWLANNAGYLVVITGAADLRRNNNALFTRFVRILPLLCDRWRARSASFQIVISTDRATAEHIKFLVSALYVEFRTSEWASDYSEVPILEVDTSQ